MTRRFRSVPVTVALGAALMLTACGGSGGDSGASRSPGPSVTTSAGVTGPIVVGMIGSFTGDGVSSDEGAVTAMKAWVSYTNDNGGLLGRKVELVVKDDHGDQATANAAVRELVESSRVVAILSDQSDVDQSWQRYVSGRNVPVIGGTPENVPFMTDANFFPTGASLAALAYGMQVAAKARGTNVGSLVCPDGDRCTALARVERALATTTGVRLAVDQTLPRPPTDFTASCQRLLAANVQSYTVAAPTSALSSMATTCAALGVTAPLVLTGSAATQTLTTVPALQGSVFVLGTAPWFSTSIPGVGVYRQALAKYVPAGLGDLDGPNAFDAWVAGQLFAKAVVTSATANVTSQSVRDGLYALRSETLGGLVAPITYRRDRPNRLDCYFAVTISGAAFAAMNNGLPRCAPDGVVATVADGMS